MQVCEKDELRGVTATVYSALTVTSVAAGSILLVPLGTILHEGSMFVMAVLDHGSSRERRERKRSASQRSRRAIRALKRKCVNIQG